MKTQQESDRLADKLRMEAQALQAMLQHYRDSFEYITTTNAKGS